MPTITSPDDAHVSYLDPDTGLTRCRVDGIVVDGSGQIALTLRVLR